MTAQVHSIFSTFRSLPGIFRRLFAHIGAVNDAYDARRRHLAVTERDLKDVAMSRDDVLGTPGYNPELPFFMQHDFEAHRL